MSWLNVTDEGLKWWKEWESANKKDCVCVCRWKNFGTSLICIYIIHVCVIAISNGREKSQHRWNPHQTWLSSSRTVCIKWIIGGIFIVHTKMVLNDAIPFDLFWCIPSSRQITVWNLRFYLLFSFVHGSSSSFGTTSIEMWWWNVIKLNQSFQLYWFHMHIKWKCLQNDYNLQIFCHLSIWWSFSSPHISIKQTHSIFFVWLQHFSIDSTENPLSIACIWRGQQIFDL